MRSFPAIIAAAAVLVGFHAGGARAQDREISIGLGVPEAFDLHGHVGIAAGVAPEYEGADDAQAVVLPLVDIRQPGFLFIRGASVNPNDGLASIGWSALNFGYTVRSEPAFEVSLGPVARFTRGREEGDNDALNGLGDIDDSLGVGGFIEARSGSWSAEVTAVSQDAGEADEGLLVAFRTGFDAEITERFSITPGLFASWGDDDYMQGIYGVSSAQAARSGHPLFDADAGFKDMGVEIGARYALSEDFSINGQIGYQRLLNDAADSPIVDDSGSRDQYRALLGVAYQF